MALSRKFIWVKVDRDRAPEVPKHYDVSAYPTFLVLGDRDENVHRFQGYKKPPALVAELEEGLRRHALYKKGQAWDAPKPRPPAICDRARVEIIPAPFEDVPAGLTVLDGALWVAKRGTVYRVEIATGRVLGSLALPPSVGDLCTDGKVLYGLEYGWTAGKPIHVIDPATGRVVRRIVTEANKKHRASGAKGIAWKEGRLHVLRGLHGVIDEVDPATGEVTGSIQTPARWLAGLCFDGAHFVAGSREALYEFDPATGEVVHRTPVHYPLRSVAFHRGAIYVMEQPIFGHDRHHRRIRVWPKETVVYKLRLEGR